mgnify:FL=1
MSYSVPSPQPLLQPQDPQTIMNNALYIDKQNRIIEKLGREMEKQNDVREKFSDRCCCCIICFVILNVLGLIIGICAL